jgi:nicotinate-nucleotide adenylyltransferase
MRLGIFGGSFDPVHNGHLELACCCRRAAALDEIWFTPTAVQPLKHRGPDASDAHRLAMLELAIDSEFGEPGRPRPRSWRVCRLEIDRGGMSYTVDTLRTIHAERPDDELFFMIGGDTLRDVPQWKEPAEIFRLATPLVVCRGGGPPPNLAILTPFCDATRQPQQFDMPAVDVSSTEIRRRIAARKSIENLVPATVADYITAHNLYR